MDDADYREDIEKIRRLVVHGRYAGEAKFKTVSDVLSDVEKALDAKVIMGMSVKRFVGGEEEYPYLRMYIKNHASFAPPTDNGVVEDKSLGFAVRTMLVGHLVILHMRGMEVDPRVVGIYNRLGGPEINVSQSYVALDNLVEYVQQGNAHEADLVRELVEGVVLRDIHSVYRRNILIDPAPVGMHLAENAKSYFGVVHHVRYILGKTAYAESPAYIYWDEIFKNMQRVEHYRATKSVLVEEETDDDEEAPWWSKIKNWIIIIALILTAMIVLLIVVRLWIIRNRVPPEKRNYWRALWVLRPVA